MKLKRYESKEEFLEKNLNILLKEEAYNETMIGICLEHESSKVNNWFLGRIEDNDEVKIIFLIDDDKKGLITYFPNSKIEEDALEFLIDNILAQNIELKNIFSSSKYIQKLTDIYLNKTNKKVVKSYLIETMSLSKIKEHYVIEENEKLLKIDETNADYSILSQIVKDIETDINFGEPCSDEEALRIANIYLKKGLYILTDESEEKIFCHAVTVRKQVNGCTLGAVISPKEYRGKGYGKKCVYELCKKLLKSGNKYISLRVRSDNEAARKVYQKIGFEIVGESGNVYFD